MAVKKGAKRAATAAKSKVTSSGKAARKAVKKATGEAARRAKKAASNPKRTVRRAAENVHESALRARQFGDSVVTAGELIKETADFVDSMSQRAKSRVTQTGSRSRKKGE